MGLIDKVHKLFKTNTHKLTVVLSKDIDEKVDFVEINQDIDDAVIVVLFMYCKMYVILY